MNTLLQHFKRLTSVSEELEAELIQRAKLVTLKKNELLHDAGKVCTRTFFIKSGVLRTYYYKDGKIITDHFAAENEWITSAYSFMKNVVDKYYIDALEPSEVYALNNTDLAVLFERFPEMERFGRITVSLQFIQQSEKLNMLQFASAAERYNYFCQIFPHLQGRLPLGAVASFLGITQETLSRVRAIF